MSTTPATPTRLAAIGMDQRQRNTLRMLFNSKCHNRFVLMEEESSEICILDLDLFNGERLWQEFRQRHPLRPLILLSLNAREMDDAHTLFVQKPIPVDRLIAALEQLSSTLNKATNPESIKQRDKPLPSPSQSSLHTITAPVTRRVASEMSHSQERGFVGTSPDIDPHDPAQLAKVYYNPEHYLQGHIQLALNLAVRRNKNVAIEGSWPAIDLMIDKRQILVDAGERQLRPYCTIPDATLEVPLRIHDNQKPTTGRRVYSISAFMWQLALWAARGRLPADTNLFQPIYLRRWPNFTRLVVTPYALAIAALWSEQPRSLIDTANTLNIPQRYVFAFYSAAKAVQLAGETRRAVDTLIAPPPVEKSKYRGLFGHVMNRLRVSKDES